MNEFDLASAEPLQPDSVTVERLPANNEEAELRRRHTLLVLQHPGQELTEFGPVLASCEPSRMWWVACCGPASQEAHRLLPLAAHAAALRASWCSVSFADPTNPTAIAGLTGFVARMADWCEPDWILVSAGLRNSARQLSGAVQNTRWRSRAPEVWVPHTGGDHQTMILQTDSGPDFFRQQEWLKREYRLPHEDLRRTQVYDCLTSHL